MADSIEQDEPREAQSKAVPPLPRIRRRNRIITSCLECRRRKLKCDKTSPCANCTKFSRNCIFLAPGSSAASHEKLKQFKEEIDTLGKGYTLHDDDNESEDEDHDLEPSPLTVNDTAYDDDGDDLMDLGVQLGKMRITERIGGYVRPKLYDEVAFGVGYEQAGAAPEEVQQIFEALREDPSPSPANPEMGVPGADFLFQRLSSDNSFLVDLLPPREMADLLLDHYWLVVHPVARLVHRPSFQHQYDGFWRELNTGFEPPPPVQALVFSALFSACVSISPEKVLANLGVEKSNLVLALRIGCEKAFQSAKLLQTTKVTTLQAFVMYLIPLCRAEISRAYGALVSMAIRLAECAGIHRDGSKYGLPPLDTHVRRMLWHHLCILDMRTCEAIGPWPQIRREDYDTKLPLNVDDYQFSTLLPPSTDSSRWTDMTLSRIRFEVCELQRQVWFERNRLEKKQTKLTTVLGLIEQFRKKLEAKYSPMLDRSIPLQAYAYYTLRVLTLRIPVLVLNRYAVSPAQALPEKLLDVVMASATSHIEAAVKLDTEPAWRQWAWINGAYHQYHSALLLMIMVYQHPQHRDAERIWPCLDYVFELPPNLPRTLKVGLNMARLQKRLEIYQSHRKQRAPMEMEQRMNSVRTSSPPSHSADQRRPLGYTEPYQTQAFPIMSGQAFGVLPAVTPADQRATKTTSTTIPSFNYIQPADTESSTSMATSQFGSPALAAPSSATSPSSGTDLDMEIDWNEFDKLFPPESNMFNSPPAVNDPPEGLELPLFNFYPSAPAPTG